MMKFVIQRAMPFILQLHGRLTVFELEMKLIFVSINIVKKLRSLHISNALLYIKFFQNFFT